MAFDPHAGTRLHSVTLSAPESPGTGAFPSTTPRGDGEGPGPPNDTVHASLLPKEHARRALGIRMSDAQGTRAAEAGRVPGNGGLTGRAKELARAILGQAPVGTSLIAQASLLMTAQGCACKEGSCLQRVMRSIGRSHVSSTEQTCPVTHAEAVGAHQHRADLSPCPVAHEAVAHAQPLVAHRPHATASVRGKTPSVPGQCGPWVEANRTDHADHGRARARAGCRWVDAVGRSRGPAGCGRVGGSQGGRGRWGVPAQGIPKALVAGAAPGRRTGPQWRRCGGARVRVRRRRVGGRRLRRRGGGQRAGVARGTTAGQVSGAEPATAAVAVAEPQSLGIRREATARSAAWAPEQRWGPRGIWKA